MFASIARASRQRFDVIVGTKISSIGLFLGEREIDGTPKLQHSSVIP
jgi:hypothetical protein